MSGPDLSVTLADLRDEVVVMLFKQWRLSDCIFHFLFLPQQEAEQEGVGGSGEEEGASLLGDAEQTPFIDLLIVALILGLSSCALSVYSITVASGQCLVNCGMFLAVVILQLLKDNSQTYLNSLTTHAILPN